MSEVTIGRARVSDLGWTGAAAVRGRCRRSGERGATALKAITGPQDEGSILFHRSAGGAGSPGSGCDEGQHVVAEGDQHRHTDERDHHQDRLQSAVPPW